MSWPKVPVDSKALDWPRKAAQAINYLLGRDGAGTLLVAVRTITATGAVTDTDYLILANATAGAITVTLPVAASSVGRVLEVKKTDASVNAVTVDGAGAETIDGAATQVLAAQYDALTVACDGAGWMIV